MEVHNVVDERKNGNYGCRPVCCRAGMARPPPLRRTSQTKVKRATGNCGQGLRQRTPVRNPSVAQCRLPQQGSAGPIWVIQRQVISTSCRTAARRSARYTVGDREKRCDGPALAKVGAWTEWPPWHPTKRAKSRGLECRPFARDGQSDGSRALYIYSGGKATCSGFQRHQASRRIYRRVDIVRRIRMTTRTDRPVQTVTMGTIVEWAEPKHGDPSLRPAHLTRRWRCKSGGSAQ